MHVLPQVLPGHTLAPLPTTMLQVGPLLMAYNTGWGKLDGHYNVCTGHSNSHGCIMNTQFETQHPIETHHTTTGCRVMCGTTMLCSHPLRARFFPESSVMLLHLTLLQHWVSGLLVVAYT